MSKALILVGGGKGGVGKSLFSMAVVDFLESTPGGAVSDRDGHLGSGRLQDVPGGRRRRAREPRRTRGVDSSS